MVTQRPRGTWARQSNNGRRMGGFMASKSSTVSREIHHWVLPAPGGTMTRGTCKHCGAEKDFSNVAGSGWVLRSGLKKQTA